VSSFPGLGTVINIAAVLAGGSVGMLVGERLPQRTRTVVTSALGLTTLLMAGSSAIAVADPVLISVVGTAAPILIVLGSLLLGGITGSLLRIEERMEGLAGQIQSLTSRRSGTSPAGGSHAVRERFIEGWLTASLLFCIGPLAILGSFDDGMGRGIDKLALKSALDGFAAMAFASSFGIGVLFAAASIAVVQGILTVVGAWLGAILPLPNILALTATGGLLLVGISLRLLDVKQVPVGDLLPALVVAPLLTQLVAAFH